MSRPKISSDGSAVVSVWLARVNSSDSDSIVVWLVGLLLYLVVVLVAYLLDGLTFLAVWLVFLVGNAFGHLFEFASFLFICLLC